MLASLLLEQEGGFFIFLDFASLPPLGSSPQGGFFFSVLAKCPTYFLRKFLKKKVGALALVLCLRHRPGQRIP